MAIIRRIEIKHFRGIEKLTWHPSPSFNCLIGPGDVGKTSVLDAIDLCIGARRNAVFTDSDFFNLDISESIEINLIIGLLDDRLKNLDYYGDFLCGYNAVAHTVEEEPATGLETILCLRLKVEQDLEPIWSLQSSRAATKGIERNLKWIDRERIAPLRIGSTADSHLSWRRGSILNKLSEEIPDASAALISAAREARTKFGDDAGKQLQEVLGVVNKTASENGVNVGAGAKAMLDAHTVSFGSGSIALHSETGVPIKGMGTGSKRLLIAGMQKEASADDSITLIDEVEIGLEPHRIIRFLKSLGSKKSESNMQVFATSHSPTVLQELSHDQVFLVRKLSEKKETNILAIPGDAQGVLRASSSAFLAKSVIICEGKTEIGFIRGIDQFRVEKKKRVSIEAAGTSLLDCDGGSPARAFQKAKTFQDLGFRVAIFIDNDVKIPQAESEQFTKKGGKLFHWLEDQSIEDAIIFSATNKVIHTILETAEYLNDSDPDLLYNRLLSVSEGRLTFEDAKNAAKEEILNNDQIEWIAKASGGKRGWFKDIGRMEYLARHVVAPNFSAFTEDFKKLVKSLIDWASN